MIENQCWAYSKQRQRCDLSAGHEGLHSLSITWGSDECFDPAMDSTVVWRDKPGSGVSGAIVTMNAGQILAPDIDGGGDDLDVVPGRCFTCNCTEAAHVPGEGCAAHACKSFLP